MTATKEIWTAPEGHRIISARYQSHRVSSDHAMLDSGDGFAVETWDGIQVHHHYCNTGWGDGPFLAMPEPNVTEEDKKAISTWSAASRLVSLILNTAEKAHYIRIGTRVRVLRGRKAPHGEYTVTKHDQGSYGPYVNIASAFGRYSYIAVANIEVIPNYEIAISQESKLDHPVLKRFILSALKEGLSLGLKVLADYIEEKELRFAGGHDPIAFAAALRFHAEKATLNTYYADCHNEFRRPFAGI